jgi:PKD repeat protein
MKTVLGLSILLICGMISVGSLSLAVMQYNDSLREVQQSSTKENNDPSLIEFSFKTPSLFPHYEEIEGCFNFNLCGEGLSSGSQPGAPVVPYKTVYILLPACTTITPLDVCYDEKVIIPDVLFSHCQIAVGQHIVSLDSRGAEERLSLNTQYFNTLYPQSLFETVSLQHKYGYSILIGNIFPVQYRISSDGTLSEIYHYPTITLTFSLQQTPLSRTIMPSTLSSDHKTCILEMVDNKQLQTILSSYNEIQKPPQRNDNQRIPPPTNNISYVIITNETLRDATGEYTFQDLRQSKLDKGLTATIVTVEDIVNCSEYWWNGSFGDGDPLFNDTQCKIRNFIRDAYETWDTTYVLLGCDGDLGSATEQQGGYIPARAFADPVYYSSNYSIASDLYYACLDGCFDANKNGIFGEIGDGFDIDPVNGEVDLLAEIVVGRAPVDTKEELSNFIQKTLWYEYCEEEAYLRDVWMVGEYVGFGGIAEFAGNYKDEIKYGSSKYGYVTEGVPLIYDIYTLYDRDWPGFDPNHPWDSGWSKQDICAIINNGTHMFNHLGHGNNFHLMKLDEPVMMKNGEILGECHDIRDNLTNTKFFFGYSQACHAGSFDNRDAIPPQGSGDILPYDAIVEHFLTGPHGAFAFIANSRYGWGKRFSTDGPSQNFDREFFDAISLYGENISSLGMAHQDSKEDNIGKISYPDAGDFNRYCYYELTFFGDPEISLKEPPLRTHDVAVYNIEAPPYVSAGEEVNINATIGNPGANDECTVIVNFSIDDVLIDTRVLPSLQSLQRQVLTFLWSNDTKGEYEITIEVAAVSGETYLDNNEQIRSISIVSVVVCSLDSLVTDFFSGVYDDLNSNWELFGDIPIWIDYTTLNKDDITYEELNATGADVILIHGAFPSDVPGWNWEFTLDEINAITQYIEEGHVLAVVWKSFSENNDLLLPLVGLNDEVEIWAGSEDVGYTNFEFCETGHPLMDCLTQPVILVSASVPPKYEKSWDDQFLGTGIYIAKGWLEGRATGCIVLNENNAVYLSWCLELPKYDNPQLLYNSIVFALDPSYYFVDPQGPYIELIYNPVQFHGFASGGTPPYSWLWEFGDGSTSTEQNPQHIYNDTGFYNVTLIVTDSMLHSKTVTTTATLKTIFAFANGPYERVVNKPVEFNGSVYGTFPPYNWSWDFGDGSFSAAQNPLHNYTSSGTYTVNLTVRDTAGNVDVNTTKATIAERLVANSHGPYKGFVGTPIQFIGSASGGFPPYREWSWMIHCDEWKTLPGQNVTYTFSTTGIYDVYLWVYDSCLVTNRDCEQTTVTLAEDFHAYANGPYKEMVFQPVQFIGNASGGFHPYTWHWDFGDGNTSNEQNPVHIYTTSGTFPVILTVFDHENFSSIDKTTAIIKNDYYPPQITIITPEIALYIGNEEILPLLFKPLIIGNIELEVNVSDTHSQISKVEFYINDDLKETDVTYPYTWLWKKRSILRFRHTVTITAYDSNGNAATEMIEVRKIL